MPNLTASVGSLEPCPEAMGDVLRLGLGRAGRDGGVGVRPTECDAQSGLCVTVNSMGFPGAGCGVGAAFPFCVVDTDRFAACAFSVAVFSYVHCPASIPRSRERWSPLASGPCRTRSAR